MTAEKLKQEINAAFNASVRKGGLTSADYARKLGVSERTAQRTIKALMGMGKAEMVGKRVMLDTVGKRQMVPIYVIKK